MPWLIIVAILYLELVNDDDLLRGFGYPEKCD
jgi:hypothetical protein